MTDGPTPAPDQAMIAAYDEFTHRNLDRRGLMTALARLAGGAGAALAVLTLLEARAGAAPLIAADDARVTGETVGWDGAGGHRMSGYLTRPAGKAKRRGTVLVIHENRGLNEHTRDVARRVALDGFIALAPDFLSPLGGTPGDEDKARAMIGQLNRAATVADGVATIAWLRALQGGNGKAGAIGFCWGGGIVNALAIATGPALKVGVVYYGPVPAELSRVPEIAARLVLHYAGLDERINAGLPGYAAALQAAGTRYEAFVYPGVNHAFNNDTSAARYDRAAAALAWGRTLAALKAGLR